MSGARVKICGLRRESDIEAVNNALPDYIGFVFAPSKRQINARTAAALRSRLDNRISAVGVFVNQQIEFIATLVRDGVIDTAQLHGDEDSAYIDGLRKACDCAIIKSVGIGHKLPPLPQNADYLLFDTASTGRGGTGFAFDWNILEEYTGAPYFLAGGLSLENVGAALQQLSPFAVDVSSGVETEGFKDAEKIRKFVQIVRKYNG